MRDGLSDVCNIYKHIIMVIGSTTTSPVTSLIAVLGFEGLLLLGTLNMSSVLNASRFANFTRTCTFAFMYGICQCASIDNQVGARRRVRPRGRVRPVPSFTILIPTLTHPPHNLIGSSTVTIYHVSDASYHRIFKFLTLPSDLPSSLKVLPKADQERPPRTSACLPVAGLRLHYRHHHHPSRSSSRV